MHEFYIINIFEAKKTVLWMYHASPTLRDFQSSSKEQLLWLLSFRSDALSLWCASVCCCSKLMLTERWHLFNFQWKLLLNFDRWGIALRFSGKRDTFLSLWYWQGPRVRNKTQWGWNLWSYRYIVWWGFIPHQHLMWKVLLWYIRGGKLHLCWNWNKALGYK